MLLKTCFVSLLAVTSATIDKAFIVKLSPSSSLSSRSLSPHHEFHKRATSLDYSVRHEFNSPDTYLGLSIHVRSDATNEEVQAQIRSIPGVLAVSPVLRATVPIVYNTSAEPLKSYGKPGPLKSVDVSDEILGALQMGGVDKLHDLGIKGKGIKIGIIDTGVDYRHPSLGGGFGPGFKIAGGWAFSDDQGAAVNTPDPLAICFGGGHGTHVAGILGMTPVPDQFNINGVAPEATLYMYRAFSCDAHGGSDAILAGMLKAQSDGVDIVSMSLSLGSPSPYGQADGDPLAEVTKKLTDAGIAVIVAASNSATGFKNAVNLYTSSWPGVEPSAISVGATANKDFPIVYSATDSQGSTLQYASIFPLDFPTGLDVYLLDDGCNSDDWNTAISTVDNVNTTLFAFQVLGDTSCTTNFIGNYNSAKYAPKYIMAYNSEVTDLYSQRYNVPSPGFFSKLPQFVNLAAKDGIVFAANYAAAGGYLKYQLSFPSTSFVSVPQPHGGYIDYYSSFGPTWHDYDLKPQISAPGGNILSTYPLGPNGGWAFLSGTSMATPYVSGAYALIKSQFPEASVTEIRERIQNTANQLPWIFDTAILSTTAQQGAGAINVYDAIFAESTISPSQLKISDNSKTEYGTANFTIKNTSSQPKTYTFSHQGAGYSDYLLQRSVASQVANYGTATFSASSLTLPAGQSSTVSLSVSAPADVTPKNLPIFSGFIQISTPTEKYSIPYLGPPYSLYNTPALFVQNIGTLLPEFYGYNAAGHAVVDTGYLEVDPALGYGSAIAIDQWVYESRIDVLPANTNITATYYAPNTTATDWDAYLPSAVIPASRVFGYESFGTLVRQKSWVRSLGAWGSDTLVTGDDGVEIAVGKGDYRWYVSLLKNGGTSGVQEEYETWLGPVFRFTGA